MVSVEDEWERQLEADDDLNLLFVEYNPGQVTVKQMQETISGFDFEAEVREE